VKVEIEPTPEWENVNGALCRVWKTTGIDHADALFFVAGVAVPAGGHPHAADFERELIELTQKPEPESDCCSAVCPGKHPFVCTEPRGHAGWHRYGAHEAECRALETDTLKRRNGRWYVKRGSAWYPLDPAIFQPTTEGER
jgi:hypothetical protein